MFLCRLLGFATLFQIVAAFTFPHSRLLITSMHKFKDNTDRCEAQHNLDLWIVGAGTLGKLVSEQWRNKFANDSIVAETQSNKRHESYLINQVIPQLRSQRNLNNGKPKAKNLVICLPPSSSSNYVEEIQSALELWSGPESGGSLVFTSTIGVYGTAEGQTVNEMSPVDRSSARTAR
jgi:hypothetical protein